MLISRLHAFNRPGGRHAKGRRDLTGPTPCGATSFRENQQFATHTLLHACDSEGPSDDRPSAASLQGVVVLRFAF